jgi:hypothetical protein
MRTDNLPQESDGVQLILQSFISNSTSDSLFQKILITMWYIWKARNDTRFQRKTWTPMQVHSAVAAHINTHLQAQAAGTNTAGAQATETIQPQRNLPAAGTTTRTNLNHQPGYTDHSQQGTPSTIAGTATDYDAPPNTMVPLLNQRRRPPGLPTGPSGTNTSLLQAQMTNRYTISTSALL